MPDEPVKKIVNYRELPGNSHKAREAAEVKVTVEVEGEGLGREAPTQKKVISGEVIQRKKPLLRRIGNAFRGDDMQSVGSYVVGDIMVPALKTLISDMVSQGIERAMFGDSAPRRGTTGRSSSYTAYNRYSSSPARTEPRTVSPRNRASHDFSEIILPERGDAQDVLDRLTDLVDNYGDASVAALYQLVGVTGSYTDDKWGWTDLRGATTRRIREGWLLELPRPQPLD